MSKEDGYSLLSQMEQIARNQVIISTPAGIWRQNLDRTPNPYQKHESEWLPAYFKALDYKVRGHAARKLCDEEGLIARLPMILALPIRVLVWILAGPLVYFIPRLGAGMFCIKRF